MSEDIENDLPKRKPTRLGCFDYSTTGAYFVTICTEDRQEILSNIVGGDVPDAPFLGAKVKLSEYGIIADKYIKQLNEFYNDITVDRYVIMPNHIHIILLVFSDGASRTSPPTKQHSSVPQFVSTFKRFCNKEYGCNIWQRSFYDHVIRDKRDFDEISKYIIENPMKWEFDKFNTSK